MAKYTRYRKYTRRNRTHWSSRMINISEYENFPSQGGSESIFTTGILARNPPQDNTTISQKFTVKNVWMQFNVESNTEDVNVVDNLQLFIMFIPQGYGLTRNMPYEHPEWIMAQKFIGTANVSNNPGYGPLSVRTRLARTLDTGDSIYWILLGVPKNGAANVITIKGVVRFNTKAN